MAGKRMRLTARRVAFLACSIGAFVALFGLAGGASAMTETASAMPSITTDQPDYNPGATVTLNGADWGAGEVVHVVVNDDKSQPWSYVTDVTADDAGAFSAQFQLPTSFAATYTVQATGASGQVATATFTDGNVNIRVIGPSTASVTWARFATANCTGAAAGSPSSGSIVATNAGNGTAVPAGAAAGQSLLLTAGSVSGFTFSNWSNGNLSPADPSTANPVCLAGDNNTQNVRLTYAAPTDTTPPVITPVVTPASPNGSNGWYRTGNITVSFTVTDPDSVVTSRSASCATDATTTTVSSDGTQTISCTATSSGGTSSNSVTIKRDVTSPSITFVNRNAPNANGWNDGNVTVNWSCSDATSGAVSATVSETVSTEGANQSSTGTCTDNAGNSGSDTQTGISIDKTDPTITASATVAGGGAYTPGTWTNKTVTVHFTCTDALSGFTAAACPADVVISADTAAAGQDVSGSVSDKAGNSASSNTINVKVDKTAPTITFTGQTPGANGDGWNNSDVTLTWSCSDALSGPAAASDSASISSEGQHQQETGHCSDLAGNSSSLTSGDVNIDKTAPTISFTGQSPAKNTNGWNNTDVTLSWTCSDALSGPTAAGDSASITTEGSGQHASGQCSDKAGNSASSTDGNVNIDKTDPTISFAGQSPAKNGNGWNNTNVTLSWTCSDALSGPASAGDSATITTEGSGQQRTGHCSDLAGNSASSTDGDVNIDKTAPGISFDGQSPAKNANGWNNTDVSLSWTCSDALSGPVSGGDSASITTEGQHQQATGQCSDLAGNSSSLASGDVNIDKTAPTTTFTGQSPAKNTNGWNNTDVTLSWTCSDALSGVTSAGDSATISSEGQHQQATGDCSDKAGNSSSSTDGDVNIDKTAPTISFTGQSPAKNGNGWNNTDVTLSWTCSDALSGPASAGDSATITTEGSGQQRTGHCSDLAGNSASSTDGNVNIDKTAPAITNLGPTTLPNGSGWYNHDVVNRFKATDGLSGLDATCLTDFPLSGSDRIQSKTTSGEGTAVKVSSSSCSDQAGNSAAAIDSAAFKIDKTNPDITFNGQSPAKNGNGWNNTNVTLSWTCSDALSGPASAGDSASITTEGQHQQATGHCSDNAGNSASLTSGDVNIDKTAPGIAFNSQTPAANANGWNNTDVTVKWDCTDALSGPVAAQVSDVRSSEGTANASGTCSDNAGNSATATRSVKIDKTPPTVTCPAVPTFLQSQLPQTMTANVTDGLSGAASGSATGSANNPAGGTVAITGLDNADNSTTVQCAYHVGNTGFSAPVDKAPTMNIAKLGRVVPVKVNLTYDGAPVTGTGTLSIGGLSQVNCTTGAGSDAIDVYAAAGSSNTGNLFRWDPTGPFWIYNFDTSAFAMKAGNCYRINVYYGGTVSSGVATGGALVGYFLMQTTK